MGDQEQKTKEARIERLLRRLEDVPSLTNNDVRKLRDVLKGVLHLLADEL